MYWYDPEPRETRESFLMDEKAALIWSRFASRLLRSSMAMNGSSFGSSCRTSFLTVTAMDVRSGRAAGCLSDAISFSLGIGVDRAKISPGAKYFSSFIGCMPTVCPKGGGESRKNIEKFLQKRRISGEKQKLFCLQNPFVSSISTTNMEENMLFLEPNSRLLIISRLLLAFDLGFYERMDQCLKLVGSSWKELEKKGKIKSQTIRNWRKTGGGPRNYFTLSRLSKFLHLPIGVIRAASLLDFTPEQKAELMEPITFG